MGEKTRLGSFIRECRTGLKYTSREMSRLSSGRTDIPSISNSYLISVENGKHIPRLDKIICLSELLKVPVTHLVDRCREDLGKAAPPPSGAQFSELFQAGRERKEMSDHTKALELFRSAYQVARADDSGVPYKDVIAVRLQIANCYRRLKISRVAKEEIESILTEKKLDDHTRAKAAFVLAEIYREEENTFLGLTVAREALKLAESVKDESLQAKLLSTLGNLATEDGRNDEALTLYRDAAVKMKKLGNHRSALLARTRQGLLMVEKREFFKAVDLLRTELAACRETDPFVRGWLHFGLAKAYCGAENYKSSRNHARSSRDCAEKLENPDLLFLSMYYLWLVARREGPEDVANMYFERLKYYRNKLDVRFTEVEQFDKAQRRSSEAKTTRRGLAS